MSTSQITEQIIRFTVQGGPEALGYADRIYNKLKSFNPSPKANPIEYAALQGISTAIDRGGVNNLLREEARIAAGRQGYYGMAVSGLERIASRRVGGEGGGTGLEKFSQLLKGNYVTQQGNIHPFMDAAIPKILGTTFLAYKTGQWTEELARSGAEIKIVSAALEGLAGGAEKVSTVLAPFESQLGGLLSHEAIKRTALAFAEQPIAGHTSAEIAKAEASFIRWGRVSQPQLTSEQLGEKFQTGVFMGRQEALEGVLKGVDLHTAMQKYIEAHDIAASEITQSMKATIAFNAVMESNANNERMFGSAAEHAGDELLRVSTDLENFKTGIVEGITTSKSYQQLIAGLNDKLPSLVSGVVQAGTALAWLASFATAHPAGVAAAYAGREGLGIGATLGGLALAGGSGAAVGLGIPALVTAVFAAAAYYVAGGFDSKTPGATTQSQLQIERGEQKERAASAPDLTHFMTTSGSGGAGGPGDTGIRYSGNSQQALDFSGGGTGVGGAGGDAGGAGGELDENSKRRISAQAQKLALVAKAIDSTGDAIIDGLTELLESHATRLRADINSLTQG